LRVYLGLTLPQIAAILQRFLEKKDYEVIVPLQLLRQGQQTKRMFNIVLGSIAAISLLVGSLGIMNIMLATVTERTREIGVRRAPGARKKDIITQFLIETMVLSVGGGLIGVILGVMTPLVVSQLTAMRGDVGTTPRPNAPRLPVPQVLRTGGWRGERSSAPFHTEASPALLR
jgi:ABC-type antimicrobial peptide transport system permease subunit